MLCNCYQGACYTDFIHLLLLIPDLRFVEFQGELQYFIGVQLDGSDHVEPLRNRLSETTEQEGAKLVS